MYPFVGKESSGQMEYHFQVKPIGIVHSGFSSRREARDKTTAESIGEIEIFKEFEEGLADLNDFSHILVLFWMHKAKCGALKVKPIYHPEKLRGLFSTRHPDRPNPIGVTVVEILAIKGNVMKVKGIDMIDGTPVLDIKPYTEYYRKDPRKCGWLSDRKFPWTEERKAE
jgi:tRNA-Thr(GGU) m(6)t(6)A37 methyltransferase TsaA